MELPVCAEVFGHHQHLSHNLRFLTSSILLSRLHSSLLATALLLPDFWKPADLGTEAASDARETLIWFAHEIKLCENDLGWIGFVLRKFCQGLRDF